jgi:hypothetical protein
MSSQGRDPKHELRRAMWSIYNHTMFRSGLRASVLPLRLQLMPLTEAILR